MPYTVVLILQIQITLLAPVREECKSVFKTVPDSLVWCRIKEQAGSLL